MQNIGVYYAPRLIHIPLIHNHLIHNHLIHSRSYSNRSYSNRSYPVFLIFAGTPGLLSVPRAQDQKFAF